MQKRIRRRGPEKGEAKKKGRKTTATTRTDNGSNRRSSRYRRSKEKSSQKCSRKRGIDAEKEVGLLVSKKQHKAVVRKEGFAHDGGPGSGQDWELSTRERRESWIFMWRRGIEEREKHVLARKAHSDVEVAKKW